MSRKISSLFIRMMRIQAQIDREHERPAPDWIVLGRLKVIRLRLKDRLQNLIRRRVVTPSASRIQRSSRRWNPLPYNE